MFCTRGEVAHLDMATPKAALGLILQIEDRNNPGQYLSVGGLGDTNGVNLGHDIAETTSHDAATNGRRRTYVGTLGKQNTLSGTLFFDSTDSAHGNSATTGIIGDAMDGTLRNWRVTYQDAGSLKMSFTAFVSDFEIQSPVDGVISANLGLTISGNITFNAF